MSIEDFAFWSENAFWVHSQMLTIQRANAASAFTGGTVKKK